MHDVRVPSLVMIPFRQCAHCGGGGRGYVWKLMKVVRLCWLHFKEKQMPNQSGNNESNQKTQ